jgi:Mn2+/Fe2+ NRAMP family transporter
MTDTRWRNFFLALGPGLIWAGAAIGVSHLVQSTRAGAEFGFALVGVILLANVAKYPAFQFGPRYAAATGESLLEGYRSLGLWAFWIFVAVTVGTMFFVQAGVTMVTAALASSLFGGGDIAWWAAAIVLASGLAAAWGRYRFVDGAMKVIIILLTLSTIMAVASAAMGGGNADPAIDGTSPWSLVHIGFLVALIGWMPSAIDISVWSSLWTLARAEQTGHKPTVRESLIDFNIGYIGTAVLALFFVALGALVMYRTGESLPPTPVGFARQLISMYTENLGDWAWPIIAVAAFTTMFSTTLTVTDAYPRVMRRSTEILFGMEPTPEEKSGGLYWLWLGIVCAVAVWLIAQFATRMTLFLDIATTLSFLTAPVLALLNHLVVTGRTMPEDAKPSAFLRAYSLASIVVMSLFALVWLAWRTGWLAAAVQ